MSLYSIYFSPTGGTKKVIEHLSEGWKEQPAVIDLADAGNDFAGIAFDSQDICLIGVPSFGGRVPEIAFSRLSAMNANGARAVLVTAYGNRAYDDTLLELYDAAGNAGFRSIAAVAAVTEHSIMRQFGTGRPDDEDSARLREYADRIRKLLDSGVEDAVLNLPGNRPFREYKGVPFKPKAGKDCTGCGICAKLCPVQAIPSERPQETNTSLCISCMRCVSVCPSHARSLNKAVLFAASQKMKKALSGRKSNELILAREKA